jgi:hypothetical protein
MRENRDLTTRTCILNSDTHAHCVHLYILICPSGHVQIVRALAVNKVHPLGCLGSAFHIPVTRTAILGNILVVVLSISGQMMV